MASSSSSEVPKAADEVSSTADGCGDADELLNKVVTVTPETRFKSLQIDDPDLSFEEKRQIASDILTRSPSQFLARFGEFLNAEDLTYFDRFVGGDYAVQFYAKEIGARRQQQTDSTGRGRGKDVCVRNRRYEALQKLIGDGEYFSDLQMKRRNPFMFEQLIGQYMSESEWDALNKIDVADMKLSTFLMEHIDRGQEENLRQMQKESDEVEEEEDTSSEDEDDESNTKSPIPGRSSQVTDEEKLMLREEFVSNMHHSFLDGNDTDFNYSSVDDNAEYDLMKVKHQDAEDSYFDAEDPKTVTPTESNSASEESMDYDAPITCFVKSDIGINKLN